MSVQNDVKQGWKNALAEANKKAKQGAGIEVRGRVYTASDNFFLEKEDQRINTLKGLEGQSVKDWCGESGIIKCKRSEATICIQFEMWDQKMEIWVGHGKNYWLRYGRFDA